MAPMKNPRRALLLAGALALAACEPAATDGAHTQTEVAIESESSAVVEVPAAESTGAESALVARGLHHLVAMSAPAGEDGTLGSGCSDEEAESLPDGDWYAFVVDYDQSHVTVDIACVYGTDTDQFEAYAGASDSEVERTALTNHVVINDVVHERTLRIDDGAQAYLASAQWEPISAAGFAKAASPSDGGEHRGLWLRVEDGLVTAVVQPYVAGLSSS
ncbi:hypothetical protein ACNI3K_07610 [Demequina sp. SO4-13]|uniref:hypothetical protein n=1 Tax=Demequina sp. SO4-13 TaxID=3401027 RepID=UPI003AF6264E